MKQLLIIATMLCIFACSQDNVLPNIEETKQPEPVTEVVENVPEETAPSDAFISRPVKLWYKHPYLPALIDFEKEVFSANDLGTEVKQVIDHLTLAPKDQLAEAIWPTNTYVREVFLLNDGTIVIDFDASFCESLQMNVVEEELLLVSLVNSLLDNFEDYERVRIIVGGKEQETFLGHIGIEYPLKRQESRYLIIREPALEDLIEVESLDEIIEDSE